MFDLLHAFDELIEILKTLESVENDKKYLSEDIHKAKDSLVQAMDAITQTINKEVQNKYKTKTKIMI